MPYLLIFVVLEELILSPDEPMHPANLPTWPVFDFLQQSEHLPSQIIINVFLFN